MGFALAFALAVRLLWKAILSLSLRLQTATGARIVKPFAQPTPLVVLLKSLSKKNSHYQFSFFYVIFVKFSLFLYFPEMRRLSHTVPSCFVKILARNSDVECEKGGDSHVTLEIKELHPLWR